MKKNISKLISMILVIAMVMTMFVGCGTSNDKDGDEKVDLYGNNTAEQRLLFDKRTIEGSADLEIFWFSSDIRDDLKDAASMYKELYGGEISYYTSSWNDRATDLALLNSSKQLPDVLLGFVQYDFPKFVEMGLFAEISDDDFDFESKYVDGAATTTLVSKDSKKYGIAVKDDPEVIIYNKEYITNLGYETPWEMYKNGKWDWEAFRTLSKQLSYDSDNDGALDHFGFNAWSLNALFVSNNTWPLTGDNTSPQLNIESKEIKETYQLLYDMANVDKSVSRGDGVQEFISGNVAMYLERPYNLKGFVNNGMDAEKIEMAPVPKGPSASEYMSFYSPNVSAISNSCENKEAALAFIECYISVQIEMTKTGPRESYGYSYTEQQKECMEEVRGFSTVNILPLGYGDLNSNLTNLMYSVRGGTTVSAAIELYRSKMQSALGQ